MNETFRTTLDLSPSTFLLERDDQIVAIGSCFVEHLSNHLHQSRFRIDSNPSGILYNPLSISYCLHALVDPQPLSEKYIVEQDGLYHSLMHHGRLSRPRLDELLSQVDAAYTKTAEKLRKAKVLILTLGSALAYRHLTTDALVANCHKIPQKEFQKEELSIEFMYLSMHKVIEEVLSINADLQIVFTVSPVRYLRDGLVESQHSKARLLVLTHRLVKAFHGCHYFPAYELVLDDLRDYRFFKSDMTHPNEIAIQYVLEKFVHQFLSPSARDFLMEMKSLYSSIMHKPIHPEGSAYREFLRGLLSRIEKTKEKYPDISFSKDIEVTKAKLDQLR